MYKYKLVWTSTFHIYHSHTTWYHHVLPGISSYSCRYQIANYRAFSVQGGTRQYPWILYTWTRHYKAVWRPHTALYCLVQVYRIQGYCLVPPCTEKSMRSLETVQGCLYKNISACTKTYWYVPKSTISYLYILFCSGMYQHILVCSSTYRLNHCMHQYILVCT